MLKIKITAGDNTLEIEDMLLTDALPFVREWFAGGTITIHDKLDTLMNQLNYVISQQGAHMALSTEMHATLDAINVATNASAAALTEVNADIDALIALVSAPGGVSEADGQAIKARLVGLQAVVDVQKTFLLAVAAKHDSPVPPPPQPSV